MPKMIERFNRTDTRSRLSRILVPFGAMYNINVRYLPDEVKGPKDRFLKLPDGMRELVIESWIGFPCPILYSPDEYTILKKAGRVTVDCAFIFLHISRSRSPREVGEDRHTLVA